MSFIIANPNLVMVLLAQHLSVVAVAMVISIALALPAGVLIARHKRFSAWVLGALGVIYTIPSIALIILLIPVLGLGQQAVIAALVLYSQVILIRNLIAGLNGIPPAVLEAADGMGMNRLQRLIQVELPLSLPILLAGFRIAVVVSIAIATIGAKFGAGGLGVLLFEGIAQSGRYDKIWAGAISVSILALILNQMILALERRFSSWRR
jgi:osmoprotectant transport system permease protein